MLAAWKPPGLMDSVAMPDISLVLDAIARGVLDDDGAPTGQLYSPAPNSDRYVGKKIGLCSARPKRRRAAWSRPCLNPACSVSVEYDDPKQRKPRKGVRVVAGKRPDNIGSES